MSVNRLFRTHDRETLNERIPGLINIARIAIVLSLLVFHLVSVYSGNETKNLFPPLEFYTWAAVYAALILLTIFKPDWQLQSLDLPNASAVVDISMMLMLTFITGGIDSGFGILVLPFIATSCLLSHGRYPMLYASYAFLLILLSMFLSDQITFPPPGVGQPLHRFCRAARRCLLSGGRLNRVFCYLPASGHGVGRKTPACLPPRERSQPFGAQPCAGSRDCYRCFAARVAV